MEAATETEAVAGGNVGGDCGGNREAGAVPAAEREASTMDCSCNCV